MTPGFDPTVLWRHLARSLPGFDRGAELRQFSGGMSNPTFLIITPDQRYVMRKKPSGQLLPSAHQVDREYRVQKSLYGSGVPVPRMFHLCEDPAIIGTSFYVMEFIEGRIIDDPNLPGFSAADRTAIYESWSDAIAAVHRVDWRNDGLETFGRHENYLQRQLSRWMRQYESAKTHEIPAMNRLIEWLPNNLPPPQAVSLIHGDCKLGNTVLHPTEPRIVALLDWELSTLGDPLADLAHSCKPWRLYGGDHTIALGQLEDTGIPPLEDFVAHYCRRTGRASIDAVWPFYMAFAMFRSASIFQGVYARFLQGNAASEGAERIGTQATLVADAGWRIASQSR